MKTEVEKLKRELAEAEKWRRIWKARYKSLAGNGTKKHAEAMAAKLSQLTEENARLYDECATVRERYRNDAMKRLAEIVDSYRAAGHSEVDLRHALERTVRQLRALGDRNSSPEDPYGGLMWHDDAELIETFVQGMAR